MIRTTPVLPSVPTFPDPWDAARAEHTRLRRRLIDGVWEQDLRQRILAHLGHVRSQAQGAPDLSANPYRVTCRELSTLYLVPPRVWHAGAADAMTADDSAVVKSGLWAQARRHQTWTIGCRDYFTRVSATPAMDIRYRPVPPDMVVAASSAETPDVPHAVSELRLRTHPAKGVPVWTWDRLDVSDPDAPIYQVREYDSAGDMDMYGLDWSAAFEIPGDGKPADYPYRTAAGLPVLPYAIHHAERVGDRLLDPWEGSELLEGSLNLAVLMSFWLHVVKDASWPQRYALNARPVGLESVDANGKTVRQEVITDPAVLLVMEQISEGAQPIIAQFEAGGDPKVLLEAIEMYAARLAADAGVSASDMQRMSGDPRSGYAISLSNEGKREAQRRFVVSFRDADQRMMDLSAILLNRAAGTNLPESGYSVLYHEVPLSPEEARGREESTLRRLEAGLLSRVDAYRELNPGVTEEQARKALAAIDAEKAAAGGDMGDDAPDDMTGEMPDNEENDNA